MSNSKLSDAIKDLASVLKHNRIVEDKERLKEREKWDEKEANNYYSGSCSCSTSSNPPCGWCESSAECCSCEGRCWVDELEEDEDGNLVCESCWEYQQEEKSTK